MMPISYPTLWVPNFVFKTRIPLTLAQNVLYKLRIDFKPKCYTLAEGFEQQDSKTPECTKKLTQKDGKLLGSILYEKYGLQTRL